MSQADGDAVRLPTPCGEHFVYYPTALVADALRRVFYAFIATCECGKAYLVETGVDGAHFKVEAEGGVIERLVAQYEAGPGDNVLVDYSRGQFACKLRPGTHS